MTKEDLTTVVTLTNVIKREQERLSKLRDWIARITQEVDGLPHASGYAKSCIDELTAQIIDCESNIQNLLVSRAESRSKLTKKLDTCITDNATKEVFVEHNIFNGF